jgi:hypothetical protein
MWRHHHVDRHEDEDCRGCDTEVDEMRNDSGE